MSKDWVDVIASKMELMNITQTKLAKKVGVSQRAISTYICRTSEPSILTLTKICDVLKLDLNILLNVQKNENCLNDLAMQDDVEINLIKHFRELSDENKKRFMELSRAGFKILDEKK